MDDVNVSEINENSMTDLQIYGITSNVVHLLSNLRKYILLTQMQLDLVSKSYSLQPIMREIYQYREAELIMDIRANLDMVYVYTRDTIVLSNFDKIRNQFEMAVSYLGEHISKVQSITDKNYSEILDEFMEKLQSIATTIATKNIFETV